MSQSVFNREKTNMNMSSLCAMIVIRVMIVHYSAVSAFKGIS